MDFEPGDDRRMLDDTLRRFLADRYPVEHRIKIAYAPVGAYVPGIDVTLSKAKIRGVESFGMMCSVREMQLGDDHDGIIEAPAAAKIGDPIAGWLGADDQFERK